MFGKLFRRKKEEEDPKPEQVVEAQEEEGAVEQQEEEPEKRPLLPAELETFKKAMGITPHNYWTWAARTNNFKLITDGKYIWVEGYEEHIGKSLPMTEQRAWSWEFVRDRLATFGD